MLRISTEHVYKLIILTLGTAEVYGYTRKPEFELDRVIIRDI